MVCVRRRGLTTREEDNQGQPVEDSTNGKHDPEIATDGGRNSRSSGVLERLARRAIGT
jgi:hypothetical protein